MDLYEKIRTLPTQPGVYLYKNAEGEVIYVGKANNLRARVRSYLLEASQANAKTGSLMREAVDLDYILVANQQEALALENNLIKQRHPRFNILLRDDKTYPYVKLTLGDRYPKVFVTRRLRKDGSAYYGPYFPGNLAYRVVELIHRSFLIPSCKVDLSRYHPRACLQYYIHRCLGPCVEGFTTPETYAQAVRDAQLFLEGRVSDLERALTMRMTAAAEAQQFEAAARLRDQLSTVHQLSQKQRIATAEESDDADVFGYHFEAGSLAVNLFHVRHGKIVDRREFFWDDLPDLLEPAEDSGAAGLDSETWEAKYSGPDSSATTDSDEGNRALYQGTASVVPQKVQKEEKALAPAGDADNPRTPHPIPDTQPIDSTPQPPPPTRHTQSGPHEVLSALLKQLYIDQHYVPRSILVPVDFPDREALSALLTARTGHRIDIAVPQRGEKRSLVDLACQNAKQSYIQRFRVLEPSRKAIQEALADTLMLPELPRRIECFDISHIQGAETVASLVVWEDGKMNKQLYRKFQIKTVEGVDDFASMREVVYRRYRRLLEKINEENPGSAAPRTEALESQESCVLGHDFSRADQAKNDHGALAPAEDSNQSQNLGAPGLESETWESTNFNPSLRVLKGHDGPGSPATGLRRGGGFSRATTASNDAGALAPKERIPNPSTSSRADKEPSTLPSLILVDGGLGQLHAAADALEELGLTTQPLASIAKKEEVIYLYGQENDPIVLDRRSPVLHLIQVIRDESHRFAIGYHRQRRAMRDRDSELLNIPGVGPQTRQRLITHFGSLRDIQNASAESLAAVLPRKTAQAVWRHFHPSQPAPQ